MTGRVLHINVGESAFLARVAAPVMAAVFENEVENGVVVIEGRGTLPARPMSQLCDTLSAVGVECSERMPLRLGGRIRPGLVRIDGAGGSQSVSGLMFALPLLDSPSEIIVDNPVSVPYIYLTKEILGRYGVNVTVINDYKRLKILIPAPQRYVAGLCRENHDGDWSAAAAFLCAAAICGRCSVTGLRKDSFQADKAVVGMLRSAGAFVREHEGAVTVMRSPLRGFVSDCTQSPDLIPVLASFAVYCEGLTEIKGMDRLSGKESDRAAAIGYMLSKAGVAYRRDDDSLRIEGMSLARRLMSGKMPRCGVYETFKDHRMVMALMLLGLPIEAMWSRKSAKKCPAAVDGHCDTRSDAMCGSMCDTMKGIVPDDYAPLSKSMPRFRDLWDSLRKSSSQ